MFKYLTLLIVLLFLGACQQKEQKADALDYSQWLRKADNATKTNALQNYLRQQGVDAVFPIYELLRSDVKWKQCGAEPFDVPPEKEWRHIIPTLRIIRDHVIPRIGPVEALSVYRQPKINACIKGARLSQHLSFHAIDMQPRQKLGRDVIINKLCNLHYQDGAELNLGLGIYRGSRFHIDAAGYRRWGSDFRSSSSPCRSLVAPQHKPR
jgi:hypothetical protein